MGEIEYCPMRMFTISGQASPDGWKVNLQAENQEAAKKMFCQWLDDNRVNGEARIGCGSYSIPLGFESSEVIWARLFSQESTILLPKEIMSEF